MSGVLQHNGRSCIYGLNTSNPISYIRKAEMYEVINTTNHQMYGGRLAADLVIVHPHSVPGEKIWEVSRGANRSGNAGNSINWISDISFNGDTSVTFSGTRGPGVPNVNWTLNLSFPPMGYCLHSNGSAMTGPFTNIDIHRFGVLLKEGAKAMLIIRKPSVDDFSPVLYFGYGKGVYINKHTCLNEIMAMSEGHEFTYTIDIGNFSDYDAHILPGNFVNGTESTIGSWGFHF